MQSLCVAGAFLMKVSVEASHAQAGAPWDPAHSTPGYALLGI